MTAPAPAKTSGAQRLLTHKADKAERSSTRKMHGVPIHNIDGGFDIAKMGLPFPVTWCLCVQDSPQNPCPCRDFVLWLPTFPKAVKKTGSKDVDGRDVYEFSMPSDAEVLVDLQMPLKLSTLQRLAAGTARRRRGRVVVVSGSAAATSSAGSAAGRRSSDANGVMAAPDKGWLDVSFGLGKAFGGLLDDLAGSNEGGNDNLSDDLSDWAADHFPAPDWLKDIFDF